MSEPNWLELAKKLNAIAQAGLTYSKDRFDVERFEQVREVAAEMVAAKTGQDVAELVGLFSAETGYPCPKAGVRAAVIRYVAGKPELLLTQELAENGAWTLPGGFADIGDTPREAVERETLEETGYHVKALKVLGVANRNHFEQAQPRWLDIWQVLFLCELVGGEERASIETGASQFFPLDALPEGISPMRSHPQLIEWVKAAVADEGFSAEFN